MGMASLDDITEKTPEEERRDEFDQMDELDQLISELDTPIDTFGDPISGMDAIRRLDDVIDELVEIGDPRAVEPLIKAAENVTHLQAAVLSQRWENLVTRGL
jgi:hypothetical protein